MGSMRLVVIFLGVLAHASLDDCDDGSCAVSAVQLGASMYAKNSANVALACVLHDPGLHAAVAAFLHVRDEDIPAALKRFALAHGCHDEVWRAMSSSPAFLERRAATLRLVGSLQKLRLQPARYAHVSQDNETISFHYESFDDDSKLLGTGPLGSITSNESVSEVTVTSSQNGPFLWNISESQMAFTIGPKISGMYLISGTMSPVTASQTGLAGQLRAGFVNLHTTAVGNWSTGPSGMAGNVSIEFETFVSAHWSWSPRPAPA